MPKIIKVVESVVMRGEGRDRRAVFRYHDMNDVFLAEFDPLQPVVAPPQESAEELQGLA